MEKAATMFKIVSEPSRGGKRPIVQLTIHPEGALAVLLPEYCCPNLVEPWKPARGPAPLQRDGETTLFDSEPTVLLVVPSQHVRLLVVTLKVE